ncbi:translation initiation factor IF-2-like [Antechinus flavipes]|uniref:translation initiation factor IF-2-like n=1 Tax=Antechinus flavipes TaxID=38775 RepID=UPI002236AF68|nr:translation initiation factor IF-2-like [Antechinus flavipes]
MPGQADVCPARSEEGTLVKEILLGLLAVVPGVLTLTAGTAREKAEKAAGTGGGLCLARCRFGSGDAGAAVPGGASRGGREAAAAAAAARGPAALRCCCCCCCYCCRRGCGPCSGSGSRRGRLLPVGLLLGTGGHAPHGPGPGAAMPPSSGPGGLVPFRACPLLLATPPPPPGEGRLAAPARAPLAPAGGGLKRGVGRKPRPDPDGWQAGRGSGRARGGLFAPSPRACAARCSAGRRAIPSWRWRRRRRRKRRRRKKREGGEGLARPGKRRQGAGVKPREGHRSGGAGSGARRGGTARRGPGERQRRRPRPPPARTLAPPSRPRPLELPRPGLASRELSVHSRRRLGLHGPGASSGLAAPDWAELAWAGRCSPRGSVPRLCAPSVPGAAWPRRRRRVPRARAQQLQ